MGTKDDVLEYLEKNRGIAVSGEGLAKQLQVSRTAIWKAIDRLRKEGFPIEAGTNKGYLLPLSSKKISLQGIKPYLDTENVARIYVLDEVDSTNDALKKMALDGAADGTVVIANMQHKGRGRKGRYFYSPEGSGIYISILIKPQALQMNDALLFTTAAAVAVCRVIRRHTKQETMIKWVNDIYIAGRKVCGILTEAVTDLESGGIEFLILGCGINYVRPAGGYPSDIESTAAALYQTEEEAAGKNVFVAALLNELLGVGQWAPQRSFIAEYKQYSMVLQKSVWVRQGASLYPAFVEDIDDEGRLVLKMENGETLLLQSGEILLDLPMGC